MSAKKTILLAMAAMFLVVPAASAATIFQDNFNGLGVALNGTTPDITTGGEVWEAGDTWLDDGIAGTTVAASANGQAAHLNFTPLGGRIYTAQATILNNQPNWIGFGFLPANPAAGNWTQTSFSVRHSNAPGYAWLLNRNSTANNQEGFMGGGTAGGQTWNGDVVDPANPVTVKIVLNTLAANWTAQWFLNGVAQGTGPVAYAAAGNPGIGGIGFSHDRNATANAGGAISAFSLTEVPEPSAVMLMLMGVIGLVSRRRR